MTTLKAPDEGGATTTTPKMPRVIYATPNYSDKPFVGKFSWAKLYPDDFEYTLKPPADALLSPS